MLTRNLRAASMTIVFGLVPAGSSPPQASYSIDGSLPTSSHMASTSACFSNQPFFNSGNLDAGMHNLTIEVTTTSKDHGSAIYPRLPMAMRGW